MSSMLFECFFIELFECMRSVRLQLYVVSRLGLHSRVQLVLGHYIDCAPRYASFYIVVLSNTEDTGVFF
jgi:hypothetical protein